MVPETDQNWIESCRGDCESKEGDIREKGKCSRSGEKGKKIDIAHSLLLPKDSSNPGSKRKKCIHQGMNGLRNKQASQIHNLKGFDALVLVFQTAE